MDHKRAMDPKRDATPPADDLAAAIHETTNALTVILGWIERARDACDGERDVLTALSRAARYTRTARTAMRKAIGAEVVDPPPMLVRELVRRTAEDLAVEAKRSYVALRTEVDAAATTLAVPRPEAVWQIVTNLLLNAIAMSDEGSDVTLRVADVVGAELVSFMVIDKGPGVAAEIRSAIFEGGTSKRQGGAGIGLRHSALLAVEAGGKLNLLETETGATFELRWPTADPAAAVDATTSSPQAQAAPIGLDGASVILLEDDARVVELLELSLSARGAAVKTVTTKEALHSELDTGNYDVMLVDLSPLGSAEDDTPDQMESGLDRAIARAKATKPDIDVVVISGSVTVQPRPDIVWVRKPFEPRELVNAIVRRRG